MNMRAGLIERTEIPYRIRRAGRLTATLLGLALIAMAISPWQQSVLGTGTVVARAPVDRQQSIDAPVKGRTVHWHVVEGSIVKAGDPIVEILDVDPLYVTRLQRRLEAARQRVQAASQRASAYEKQSAAYSEARKLKVRAAELKTTMGQQKVKAARQKVEAAKAEQTTNKLNLQREERLAKDGLSSRRALELAQLAANKANAQYNLQLAGLSEAKANLTALEAERFQAGAEGDAKVQSANAESRKANAEAAYAAEDMAKLEVELSRQDSRIVRAPRAGTILQIAGGLGGKVVSAGEQLALLIPDTKSRAVELWVDGNDLPLMEVGRTVRVQFEGWPAVQFVGWPSVAVGTFPGKVAVVDSSTIRVGQFRVLVTPDVEAEGGWPKPEQLSQGLRAKGWVLLDEVSLGWELWRRFNGFPQSVAQPPDKDVPKSGGKSKGKA